MQHRSDIQILRGFAVLVVLLYHLQIPGFENGYLGVDIFFVLSGYLMALLYDKGSAIDFYVRRFNRLLPAYLVTIAVTTLIVIFIAVPSDASQRFERSWFDLFGLSNVAFWMETTYFDSSAFKPLLNLWSLGVELQYYLLVPFLLPLLRGRNWLLYLTMFGSVAAMLLLTVISPKTSFFLLPFRVWEFLLGSVAAWYVSRKAGDRWELPASILLLAFLAAVIGIYPLEETAFDVRSGHPGLAAILVSICAAVLLAKPLHRVISDENRVGRTISIIGDYSYSIYLVHFPVIVLLNYEFFRGTALGFRSVSSLLLMLVLTATSAYLMFNYVERTRFNKNFTKIFSVIVLGTVAVLLAGPSANKQRYSEEQNLVFDAWSDRDVYRCGKTARILKPTETVCTIGTATGSEKVFLVGNSHADSIKKQFADSMSENGITTYFHVSNNPLMTPGANAETIVADVDRLGIAHVVIHFSPSFYLDKKYLSELERFLAALRELGIGVSFIAPVPTYEFHVPEALYRRTLDRDFKIRRLNVAQYELYNSSFSEFVDAHSVAASELFYTHKLLCEDSGCLIQKEGRPLYFDSTHLTLTGAELLAPVFDSVAKAVIETAR